MTDISGEPDIVHGNVITLDTDFGNLGNMACVAQEEAKAQATTLRKFSTPARSLCCCLDDSTRACCVKALNIAFLDPALITNGVEQEGFMVYACLVRELCDELLGPLEQPADGARADGAPAWEPNVAGLSKRELLRDTVLPALSSNRALQRLLSEYVEQLNSLR